MKIHILALGLFFILSHNVYAQTPFYQGKQIRVVVGSPPADFMTAGRGCCHATCRSTFPAIQR
jgi:hypothetical protein